jgi:hypothetical protein
MPDHHAGVIVEDGAQDGFDRAVVGADRRAVHEVSDPQVINIVHLEGFAHIAAFGECKPSLGFHDPQQGVVVNGGLAQEILVPKIFIELLNGERGVGFAFDFDDVEGLLIEAFGPASVCAAFGFEGIKALLAVLLEPGFHGGDFDFSQAIAGEEVLAFGLLAEVLILSPCGLGEYRRDDLEAFEGDTFSDVLFHGFFPP